MNEKAINLLPVGAEHLRTTAQIAEEFPISERHLRGLRYTDKGPPWYRLGRKNVFYDRREVAAFFSQRNEGDGVTRELVTGCLDCRFRLVEVGGDNRDLCFVADRRALPRKRRPPKWCPLPLFVGRREKVEGEDDGEAEQATDQ